MNDLVARVRQIGLEHVQLALGPILLLDEKQKARELAVLRDSGIKVTAGMIAFPGEDYSTIPLIRDTGGFVPERDWPDRKQSTILAGRLAVELGLKQVSAHIGFVPPSNQESYGTMVTRVREVATGLADLGVELLMETGQERAAELLQFINDLACRTVHVNFDPANMVLYGAGDPIDAVHVLGRHIAHVHVKDAVLSDQPGVNWGTEVPFGAGQVGVNELLAALKAVGYAGPLAVEREAGNDRIGDVQIAIDALRAAGV